MCFFGEVTVGPDGGTDAGGGFQRGERLRQGAPREEATTTVRGRL